MEKNGDLLTMATKFTKEICETLCTLHEDGLPQKTCADLVGIDRKTLYNWIQKGKKAKSGKYKEFYHQWQRANAKFIQTHQSHISENKDWRAHQYLLQVTDPETYVITEKTENETKIQGDIRTETLNRLERPLPELEPDDDD